MKAHILFPVFLILLYLIGFLGLPIPVEGQTANYSQFYANSLYLNPALTGLNGNPRINLNYRNQWPRLSRGHNAGYESFLASYDQQIAKINSGVGVLISGDRAAAGLYSKYSASIFYAYQIRVEKRWAVKLGVDLGYVNTRIAWDRLRFGDQINPITGFRVPIATREERPSSISRHAFDMALGFVLFHPNFYTGFSVRHFTRPRDTFIGNPNGFIPVKYTVHLGGVVYFDRDKKYNFSPSVLYTHQLNYKQLTIGGLFGVHLFYTGLWFRHTISNSDAVILSAGFTKKFFRIGYSYDITVSRLGLNSGGAHEVALSFYIKGKSNSIYSRKKKNKIDCPPILKF